MIGRFRKKAVVIEAVRVSGATEADAVAAWCGGVVLENDRRFLGIEIRTLEGNMRADPGDWIVKGIKGEFYPVKPEIFTATYEMVEEEMLSRRSKTT